MDFRGFLGGFGDWWWLGTCGCWIGQKTLDIGLCDVYNLGVLIFLKVKKMTKSKETPTLEQQIQAKIDELNALKEKQRKLENQQKIILGALVLKHCENDLNFCQKVIEVIETTASERDAKKLAGVLDELKSKLDTIKIITDVDVIGIAGYSDDNATPTTDETIKHNIF